MPVWINHPQAIATFDDPIIPSRPFSFNPSGVQGTHPADGHMWASPGGWTWKRSDAFRPFVALRQKHQPTLSVDQPFQNIPEQGYPMSYLWYPQTQQQQVKMCEHSLQSKVKPWTPIPSLFVRNTGYHSSLIKSHLISSHVIWILSSAPWNFLPKNLIPHNYIYMFFDYRL